MSLKLKIRSRLMNIAASERMQRARRSKADLARKLSGGKHVVTAFIELDDPYSYLLCQYLHEFVNFYEIELDLRLTDAIKGALRPAPELYSEYAVMDCRRLAAELGLPFLDRNHAPPVEHRRALLDALSEGAGNVDYVDDVVDTVTAYWRGDTAAVARRVEDGTGNGDGDALLAANQQKLKKLGHYNTATLHYGGEWYWGVDRLHYLIERLEIQGLNRQATPPPKITSIATAMQLNLPVRPPAAARDLPPFELFYSFRSPYSWLSLQRMLAISDAFGLELIVRPVLPMVMRGMQVPKSKLLYIIADTSREARRRNVPFGKFADPVGVGVERCMAVFEYADSERRGRDFLLAAGEAIWSKGIDVATDAGLRKVTGKAGLFWPEAKAALDDDDEWRMKAEANRADMMNSGSWGVPTIRIGDFVTWGQDRDWLIARHLEELCDTGEGILI